MTIKRLRDGATGWAFQMAIPFTFEGRFYTGGHWIAEVHGSRYVVAHDVMRSHYMEVREAREPWPIG